MNPSVESWRNKLVDHLAGDRLVRLERSLGRDPGEYILDPKNADKIPDFDIEWFFRAIEAGHLAELPNGDVRAPRSGSIERFYSHGLRTESPVRVGIAVEPVITVGALARLMGDYDWPMECLGLQTGKYEFDLTCYAHESEDIAIQCEVKTSARDVDRMCEYFEARANGSGEADGFSTSLRKNLDPKYANLTSAKPQVFWALGPGGHERVYLVHYSEVPGVLHFERVDSESLRFNPSQ